MSALLSALPPLQLAPEKLPSLPAVALQIVELCRQDNVPIPKLQSLLAQDPALSARVLRAANSPCYARGQQVKTLSRALVLLGAKTTSVMALSFSLKATVDKSRQIQNAFPWDEYWRHSIVAAVSCRSLARIQRLWNPEEAFFCGLLSRIGQIALATAAPDTYQHALKAADGKLPTSTIERESLGFSQQEVGASLLRSWGLPDIYTKALEIWQCLETGEVEGDPLHGAIVGCGDEIAKVLTHSESAASLHQAQQYASDYLRLTHGELHRIVVALETEVQDAEEIFQTAEKTKYDFAKILESARQQLIEVSLRTSVELDQAVGQVRELSERQGFLENAAYQDELTKLPNRRALERELGEIAATRRERPLSILLVDVDHFKSINDTMGHQAGDAVLQHLGQFLTKAMRRSDFVGRYGGEEFVVLVPNASLSELEMIAERIRRTVQNGLIRVGETEVNITVSIGGARVSAVKHLESVENLMNSADKYLYEAKRNGRNQCICRPFSG